MSAGIELKGYNNYTCLMDFEFDPSKSAANRAKHGISFDDAAALFADDRLLVVPARTVDEERFLAIGLLEGRHWSAIFTRRRGRIRLISVRRARNEEVNAYESA
jgi:uncharacterized DUF497 family protein